MNNYVSLKYLDDYNLNNLEKSIEESIERLNLSFNFHSKIKALIKVCMPEASSPDMASSTHPAVVQAVVNCLSKRGVTCIVADSPYGKYNITNLNSAYLNTGMLEMANLTTCELNHDLASVEIPYANGIMAKSFKILKIATEVDIIVNIGKLKVDERLSYLGATANLFGLIPGEFKTMLLNRMFTMSDFNNYIIDMNEALKNKVKLNILDAVVALEKGKTQRMLNCVAVSENPYCLDAAMFNILGIQNKNSFLKQAEERGLFDENKAYRIVGDNIDKFKVEDFSIIDSDNDTIINKTSNTYFKAHQQRVCIDRRKCKGCKICSKICPNNAITMKCDKNGELFATIDYKHCIYCNKCLTACPYHVAKMVTPLRYKQLIKEINKHNDN